MPVNSILDGPIKTLLSNTVQFDRSPFTCSFDWGEGFNDFKCGTFTDRFQRVGTASMAVKGLIQKYRVWCRTLMFALNADAWVCVLLQGLGSMNYIIYYTVYIYIYSASHVLVQAGVFYLFFLNNLCVFL